MQEEIITVSGVQLLVKFEFTPEDLETGVLEDIEVVEAYDYHEGNQNLAGIMSNPDIRDIENQLWLIQNRGRD